MAKRARRELARLNEQTQFSLAWPAVSPASAQALSGAVRALGAAAREGEAGLVLGVNAVTRALERRIAEKREQRGREMRTAGDSGKGGKGGDGGGGGEIALILIARHARQAFVQHIPLLALQAGHARAGSAGRQGLAASSSSSTAAMTAATVAATACGTMVKVCGLPLTSGKLGEMFGIHSVAALAIRAGDHLDAPAFAAVIAAARDEHALTPSCFCNLDARQLLLLRAGGPDGEATGGSGRSGRRRRRRRSKRRKQSKPGA